jgi:2-methylcitrate dehydratase PrpD
MRHDQFSHLHPSIRGANLTRRGLLQRAGWAVAATALPRSIALGAENVSPVMARLSSYMSEARDRALPDDVVEKTKHHVLDTIAAMISGSQLLAGQFALRFARAQHGEAIATVAASDIVCNPIEAAFANAMLAHSDETDDSHAPSQSHPGCSIVPAALAASERFGIDGTRFLRSVALGYDVGTRMTMSIGRPGFQTENHMSTHSVANVFGSAAAAACSAAMNSQQIRWVLGYAAQEASGTKAWQRDTDHIQKAFLFAGMGARGGVTAVMLVQSGATGVDDFFSGADNFLSVFGSESQAGILTEKLGERYEVVRTNIKKWTVGSPIQAPMDALVNLQKKHSFTAAQVQRVVVRVATTEGALVDNRGMPDICMQHLIAVMLLDKTVSFTAAHDKPRMQDPAVLRERAKVQLIGAGELERRLPHREAIVEVTLTDGTKLTEHVTAVRGTAENPMPREEVVAKARDLMAPVLGAATTASLIEKVLALESVKDIRELRPLLQRA